MEVTGLLRWQTIKQTVTKQTVNFKHINTCKCLYSICKTKQNKGLD